MKFLEEEKRSSGLQNFVMYSAKLYGVCLHYKRKLSSEGADKTLSQHMCTEKNTKVIFVVIVVIDLD